MFWPGGAQGSFYWPWGTAGQNRCGLVAHEAQTFWPGGAQGSFYWPWGTPGRNPCGLGAPRAGTVVALWRTRLKRFGLVAHKARSTGLAAHRNETVLALRRTRLKRLGPVAHKARSTSLVAHRDGTVVALRRTGTEPLWPCGALGRNGWGLGTRSRVHAAVGCRIFTVCRVRCMGSRRNVARW